MKLITLLFIMTIVGCVSTEELNITSVTVADKTYSVEIASSQEERRIGLMNRPILEESHGMLFIFDDENYRSFWMKDTLIPLDIIFISSDFKIVDITTLEPCGIICNSYLSKEKAMYVLEVNLGSGIKIGDIIQFHL